jgi:phage terminase large subunit-like protein
MRKLAQLKSDARAEGWHDLIRCENDERALLRGYRFDPVRAERVRLFFEVFLRHNNTVGVNEETGEALVNAGDPFELLDWQWNGIIRPLYGWIRPNGLRRYTEAYISVAKKNGKSTLTSGLGLYHTVADREPNPVVCVAACDRDQASIVYDHAAGMVAQSPELRKKLVAVDTIKRLRIIGQSGYMRALSRETMSKEGIDWSFLIFDELHRQPNDDLWNTLKWGGRARRQPMLAVITTAGDDLESICYQRYDYAKKTLAGEVEDLSFFAYIAEAPDAQCALDDPDALRAANPSIGAVMPMERLQSDARAATGSYREEVTFRRYTLNQWVSDRGKWLPMSDWDATAGTEVNWDSLAGADAVVGVDLAAKYDLTASVLVTPYEDGYAVLPRFYLPEDTADQLAAKGNFRYRNWAQAGFLTLIPGGIVDYRVILEDLLEWSGLYHIRVAIDPHTAAYVSSELTDAGIEVVEVAQTLTRLCEPSTWLEAWVRDRKLYHEGNPPLRWCASNVRVNPDHAGRVRPLKPKGGGETDKIDGISALVTAFAEMLRMMHEGGDGWDIGDFIQTVCK